jgi:hypothetical protein
MRGWIVVAVVVVVVGVGCDKGKRDAPSSGSAGSGSAAVAPADASAATDAAPDDAASAAPVDAGLDAAVPTGVFISRGGVGKIGKLEWWKDDETTVAAKIEKALAELSGVKVSFDVMDVPGEVEREEGYFSVKRGGKEIAQVFRQYNAIEQQGPAAVVVWSPDIPTYDGTRVGDKVSTVIAKHEDFVCAMSDDKMVAEFVSADLTCISIAEPEITYIVSPKGIKSIVGRVRPEDIATAKLVAIAHEHK